MDLLTSILQEYREGTRGLPTYQELLQIQKEAQPVQERAIKCTKCGGDHPLSQCGWPLSHYAVDWMLGKLQVKNDAALSEALDVAPPVISKIRHGRRPVGARMLVRLHELTGMTIRELRAEMKLSAA